MHMRRSLALVSGALLLTAPLAGCGFDEATEQVNTIASGATDRDATVDVLNAVIVSGAQGSGTFIATFVNNDTTEDASVESLEAAEPDTAEVTDFSPITLGPGQLLNLAGEGEQGPAVEGDIAAGQVVPMTLQLSGSQIVEMDVPVVAACHEFEGLDHTAGTESTEQCEIGSAEGAG